MSKPIITIIGLGLTGASMGLGLQREEGNFEIVGHDKLPEVSQEARKSGAVQRTEWNLYKACDGAELIVLAVPLHELETLLPLLAEELKPGTLILALGNLLQPAIDSGNKHMPDGVQFVAGHAVVTNTGVVTPRADLYEKAVFALAAGVKTDAAALQLASDFVERVGASTLFVDAVEHDGIIAGVEQLPLLLGAALMRASSHTAGWREARRLAGRPFANTTDIGGDAAALFAALQANKEGVLWKLRTLRAELAEWQRLLEEEIPEGAASEQKDNKGEEKAPSQPLLNALKEAVDARQTWEAQVVLRNWDEMPSASTAAVESGGFLKQMFLGGLGNRQRKGR